MSKIKYIIVILAGLTAITLVFIPTKRESNDGQIHLRYWHLTASEEQLPYNVRKFNAIQDSVVVECTPIPWLENEKKVLTSVLSGNPPDVINLVTPVARWASRMALTPLDELIHKDAFDTTVFFPPLWQEMKWQNRIFALPIYTASFGFFYNKALFREVGLDPDKPPQTWDEVRDCARLLTKRDENGRFSRMGFVPHYGKLQTSILMAYQLQAQFLVDNESRVDMANSGLVTGLQWVVDYYKEFNFKQVSAFEAGLGFADQHGFISGKVAMMVLDSSFPNQIEAYRPGLDYGVAEIPHFEGHPTASSSGAWWFAIPRGAKHPQAAWEFMKFSVNKQTQLEAADSIKIGLFPANRLAANDSAFINKSEAMPIFVKQMDVAHSPTIVPMAHSAFWREFVGARERALHGLQTPEEALRQAGQVIQRELDRALEYDNYVRDHMEF